MRLYPLITYLSLLVSIILLRWGPYNSAALRQQLDELEKKAGESRLARDRFHFMSMMSNERIMYAPDPTLTEAVKEYLKAEEADL